ncbi:MAG: hypothetical protein R3C10_16080 [Pirellulales bacterium]|nr:hypothetical protein [Planctomycetales bacterium]
MARCAILTVLLLLLLAVDARAQRVEFPTPVSSAPSYYGPSPPNFTAAAPQSTAPASSIYSYGQSTSAYGATGTQSPILVSQAPVTGPPTAQPVLPPPNAGAWDPYAPAAPASTGAYTAPPGYYTQDNYFVRAYRVLNRVDIRNTSLFDNGATGLGVNSTDLRASFAVPFFNNPEPLLITPGFSLDLWSGPQSGSFNNSPDLPPQTYAGYLEFSWRPVITSWLSGDLAVAPGIWTDFNTYSKESWRFPSRGMFVITSSPTLQITGGVWYLDRNKIKLLPAGGLIWRPSPDMEVDILFPNPRFAKRFTALGNCDWWWYLAGGYGGGSWTIERAAGYSDSFDYNDIRVSLGLEFRQLEKTTAYVEFGYVFDRSVEYVVQPSANFDPKDTWMVRGGLTF